METGELGAYIPLYSPPPMDALLYLHDSKLLSAVLLVVFYS